jgi:hypothetical protein
MVEARERLVQAIERFKGHVRANPAKLDEYAKGLAFYFVSNGEACAEQVAAGRKSRAGNIGSQENAMVWCTVAARSVLNAALPGRQRSRTTANTNR